MKRKPAARQEQPSVASFFGGGGGQSSRVCHVECPLCTRTFSKAEIERHAAQCGEQPRGDKSSRVEHTSPPPIQKPISADTKPPTLLPNAFSALLSAQASASLKQAQSRGVFRLDMDSDGKICPSFQMDCDTEAASVDDHNDAWVSEVQVRRLLLGVNCNSEEESGENEEVRCSFTLRLATNMMSAPSAPSSTGSSSGKLPAAAILKSMLQKGARRKLHEKALRLCAALLATAPADCLRRIPIIVVEDSSLHPAVPVAVWAMAAHAKGFDPPEKLLAAILHMFAEVCGAGCRDSANPARGTRQGLEVGRRGFSLHKLRGPARTLVFSLLLRASYGGMEGDVAMLESFARQWATRLSFSEPEPEINVSFDALANLPASIYLSTRYLQPLSSTAWGHACLFAYSDTPSPDVQLLRQIIQQGATPSLLPNVTHLTLASLRCRRGDLVPEGLDPHCDSSIVPRIVSRCGVQVLSALDDQRVIDSQTPGNSHAALNDQQQTRVANAVRSCVWTFRGSINARTTWLHPVHCPEEAARAAEFGAEQTFQQLAQKKEQARVWGCIAKELTAAVSVKIDAMGSVLPST